MKKINDGLKRKVLCGLLAVAALGACANVDAAYNFYVNDSKKLYSFTNGTYTSNANKKRTLTYAAKAQLAGMQVSANGYSGKTTTATLTKNVDINVTNTGRNDNDNVGITAGFHSGISGSPNSKSITVTSIIGTAGESTVNFSAKGNQTVMGIFLEGTNGYNGPQMTINGTDLNVSAESTGYYAHGIYVANNTTDLGGKETTKLVINSDNTVINVKADTAEHEIGIATYSQGEVEVNGNLEINAANAIVTRGNSKITINKNGDKTVKINGDVVFDYDAATSGTTADADLTLNLSGTDSSFTGRTYVNGNPPTSKAEVDGLEVDISDGASWNVTGDSFVNNANVSDGGAIKVRKDVDTFDADKVTLTGGTFNAEGGTTTISTLNANGDSTVNLTNANLNVAGGTADIAEFNASGTSALALKGTAKVTLESGEAELDSITTSGTSSLTLGSDAVVKADTIDVDTSATLKVGEGATLVAEKKISATGEGKIEVASDATVEAKEITVDTSATLKVGEGATLVAEKKISATGEGKIEVASDATVEAKEITVDTGAKLNVDSGATVKADAITAIESSTVEFASGSNVSATMYVGGNIANVKVLGNFSGTFYKPGSGSGDPVTLSNDEVKKILGISTTTTNPQSMQLDNGDYTVKMDVGDDGNFNLRSYDLSDTTIKKSHQLGTWDTNGNYTAYGNYDANGHEISGVTTLSAEKISLGGVDLQKTLDTTNETVSNVITQVNTLTKNVVDITKTQNQAILENSQAIVDVKNMAQNGIDQANREIHANASAIQNNAADIAALKNLSGLSEAGESNVKKLAMDAVEVTGGTGVTVSSKKSEDGTKITYEVSMDAGSIGGEIGTGKVEAENNKLITGKTMYEELRPTMDGNYVKQNQTTAENLEALDAAIGSDKDYGEDDALNNITKTTANPLTRSNDGTPTTLKANIGALDAAMGKVSKVGDANDGILDKDGHLIGSSESGYGANLSDAVRAVDEKVGNLNTNNEFCDSNNNLIGKYNVLDSDESLANNLEFIDHAIGTTADGAYVSSSNSVGQNLNALDQGLSNLDRGLNDLGDRLNKVGAGAAALAALHPEGFDPDDKLSFAVGYGHYKNANASAIGAFYKPNRDTTFSIASTIGNGSTMLNAGVSFKIGKSSHVEKTMVAKADYEALQQKVAAQDEKMAAQDAEIEELKKQVALLVAKG